MILLLVLPNYFDYNVIISYDRTRELKRLVIHHRVNVITIWVELPVRERNFSFLYLMR